jgi:flagellar M-ring protein FliF
MRFDINKLKGQFEHALRGFTRGQKTMMGLAAVAVIVGLFIFTRSQGGTPMSVVYSDLDPTDASAITSELDSLAQPYELADQGRTIKVPSADVSKTRIALAGADITPTGGDAWGTFDKQGITATQLQQKVALQRSLSNDLAMSIEQIEGIDKARVNLVMPEDDVFAQDSMSASASIMVKTKSSDQLGKEQVKTIANLVATGVPGLTTDRITVTDQNARSLWFPGKDDAGSASGDDAFATKAKSEEALASKVQSALELVTGPGKARVAVNADLDMAQAESVERIFNNSNPAGTAPLLQRSSGETEQYNGAGDGQPLVPGGVTGATTVDGAAYNKQSNANEYANNSIERIRKETPGAVTRQSVSVILDEGSIALDRVDDLRNIVTEAAGLDIERGDTLAIERFKFDTTLADEAAAALSEGTSEHNDTTASLMRGLGVAVLVLGALFIAWRSLRKKAQPTYIEIDPFELDAVRELDEIERRALEASELAALSAGSADVDLSDFEDQFSDVDGGQLVEGGDAADDWETGYPVPTGAELVDEWQAELDSMTDLQSEEMAQLLRHWLGDRRVGAR